MLYNIMCRLISIYVEHKIVRAFEPGDSGLPYYCTPPVCVPDVIGALAVSQFVILGWTIFKYLDQCYWNNQTES